MEETLRNEKRFLTSTGLKLIAMLTMLIDHAGGHINGNIIWMRFIGRIAFVLYAFMIVEGMSHTHDKERYLVKLLALAAISEVPFDLMGSGRWYNPESQNVVFTLAIGASVIYLYELILAKGEKLKIYRMDFGIELTIIGTLLTTLFQTDYSLSGVPLIMMFYLWNKSRKPIPLLIILSIFIALTILNVTEGVAIGVVISHFVSAKLWVYFGAYLALPFLLLYNGRKGYSSKIWQWGSWGWYPLHMLLILVARIV